MAKSNQFVIFTGVEKGTSERNLMVRLPLTHRLKLSAFTVRMCVMSDSIDGRLIQLLQENAHQSSEALAKRLGVSSSTIRRRIQTLIQKEIIRIVARPDPTKIGYAITAIIAFDIDHENLESALETLNNRPDVHWLVAVSGRFDAMALIWAISTDGLFKQLDEIGKIEGIKNMETFIRLHVRKRV